MTNKLIIEGEEWVAVGQIDEHPDTIEAMRAENAKLRALLNDCASELADEINARYGDAKHIHRHRYDRDMQTVRAARAALGEK